MLKTYEELRKLDVTKYCDTRKAKDDNGKSIDVLYLNWAKCVDLLHENGATEVYYTPLKDANGSFVFSSLDVQNKDGRLCGCYFVSVEIHIDGLVFTMDYPLMNGTTVVYADTLNQLRVSNAHARAFVKGVAIRTGLGFGLWVGGDETAVQDDISGHSILVIKRRVEETLTSKMQYMDESDVLAALGINKKQLQTMLQMYERLHTFEKALNEV